MQMDSMLACAATCSGPPHTPACLSTHAVAAPHLSRCAHARTWPTTSKWLSNSAVFSSSLLCCSSDRSCRTPVQSSSLPESRARARLISLPAYAWYGLPTVGSHMHVRRLAGAGRAWPAGSCMYVCAKACMHGWSAVACKACGRVCTHILYAVHVQMQTPAGPPAAAGCHELSHVVSV